MTSFNLDNKGNGFYDLANGAKSITLLWVEKLESLNPDTWAAADVVLFLPTPSVSLAQLDLARLRSQLLTLRQSPAYAQVKFLWLHNPEAPLSQWHFQSLSVAEEAGKTVVSRLANFDLGGYSLAIPRQNFITKVDKGWKVHKTDKDGNETASNAYLTTGYGTHRLDGVGTTLLQLTLDEDFIGCWQFSITLSKPDEPGLYQDLEALDIGFRLFYPDPLFSTASGLTAPSAPQVYQSQRYPLFDETAAGHSFHKEDIQLWGCWDPLSDEGERTFFGFTESALSQKSDAHPPAGNAADSIPKEPPNDHTLAPAIPSGYRTNLGYTIYLTPQSNSRLVFAAKPTSSLGLPVGRYLVPKGEFNLTVPPHEGNAKMPPDEMQALMCGLSGVEYVKVLDNGPCTLGFKPNYPAFAPSYTPILELSQHLRNLVQSQATNNFSPLDRLVTILGADRSDELNQMKKDLFGYFFPVGYQLSREAQDTFKQLAISNITTFRELEQWFHEQLRASRVQSEVALATSEINPNFIPQIRVQVEEISGQRVDSALLKEPLAKVFGDNFNQETLESIFPDSLIEDFFPKGYVLSEQAINDRNAFATKPTEATLEEFEQFLKDLLRSSLAKTVPGGFIYKNQATTAWAYVKRTAGNAEPAVYYAQPDQSILYEPAQSNLMSFLEVPTTDLPENDILSPRFEVDWNEAAELDRQQISDALRYRFKTQGYSIHDDNAPVIVEEPGIRWTLADIDRRYEIRKENNQLKVHIPGVFPLFPYGSVTTAPTDCRQMELQVVNPLRRAKIQQYYETPTDEETEQAGPAGQMLPTRRGLGLRTTRDTGSTEQTSGTKQGTTPQGLLARFDLEFKCMTELILARSKDPQEQDRFLKFTDIPRGSTLWSALQANELMLVVDDATSLSDYFNDPNNLSEINTQLTIAGWTFFFDVVDDVGTPLWREESVLIFKYHNKSLLELTEQPSAWSQSETFVGDVTKVDKVRQRIRATLENAIANDTKDTDPKNRKRYAPLANIARNPAWSGIVGLNIPVPPEDSLPPELKALAGGIKEDKFFAQYVGINDTPVKPDGNTLKPELSSLFGLIDYEDNEPPEPSDSGYNFQVLSLRVLFENSLLTDFASDISVTLDKLFEERTQLQEDGDAVKYQLQLIKADRVSDLPRQDDNNSQKRLIIVAQLPLPGDTDHVQIFYHVRIFNEKGETIIDKGRGKFFPDEELITQLEDAFQGNDQRLSDRQLIQNITSGLGHNISGRNLINLKGTAENHNGKTTYAFSFNGSNRFLMPNSAIFNYIDIVKAQFSSDPVLVYGLKLIPLKDKDALAKQLPTTGKSLVFVAKVGQDYHARIFDQSGKIIFGADSSPLLSPDQAASARLSTQFQNSTVGQLVKIGEKKQREFVKDLFNAVGLPYDDGNDGNGPLVTGRFSFWTQLGFRKIDKFDAFSFGPSAELPTEDDENFNRFLRASNLVVTLEFPLDDPNDRTFKFIPDDLTFQLDKPRAIDQSNFRPTSLYAKFPINLKGFIQGSGKPKGFLPVKTPLGKVDPKENWYGMAFELDLGSLGALSSVTKLVSQMVIIWLPNTDLESNIRPDPQVYVAMKLPGLSGDVMGFSLQSVLKLAFKTAEFIFDPADEPKNSTYLLKLRAIVVKLLVLSLPPNGQTELLLFGNSKGRDQPIGWYAAYAKEPPKDPKKAPPAKR